MSLIHELNLPTTAEIQSIRDHLITISSHTQPSSVSVINGTPQAITEKTEKKHVKCPPGRRPVWLGQRRLLTITPISSYKKKPSHVDYVEQQERVSSGKELVWDDSKYNFSRVGDLFGFFMYEDEIRIHRINKVSSPEERLPSWSDNVGQGDRNVVHLDKEHVTIPWVTWVELVGPHVVHGTSSVKTGLNEIITQYESKK